LGGEAVVDGSQLERKSQGRQRRQVYTYKVGEDGERGCAGEVGREVDRDRDIGEEGEERDVRGCSTGVEDEGGDGDSYMQNRGDREIMGGGPGREARHGSSAQEEKRGEVLSPRGIAANSKKFT
jgi:hypothetical protein